MKKILILLIIFALYIILSPVLSYAKKTMNGPIEIYGRTTLRDVHVISNSYGFIVHGKLILINSKVSAPVGVKVYGFGSVYLQNDYFNCELGVKYMQAPVGDTMINNTFAGRISNSSDFSSGTPVPGMGSPFPFMP